MDIQEFDFDVNLTDPILWQYNQAISIQSLVLQKQAWFNLYQTQFWEDWYADVFDLATANDFGLAVWSIILGLPLFIDFFPDESNKPIWGLADDDTFANGNQNFDNGNFAFYSGDIVLTTEQKRIILQLRYFQLTCRGAAPETNAFLNYVFRNEMLPGQFYMLDGLDMTITYVYTFALDPILLLALQVYDILPRPAAVGIKYIDGSRPIFGFADDDTFSNHNQNFDNGNFRD